MAPLPSAADAHASVPQPYFYAYTSGFPIKKLSFIIRWRNIKIKCFIYIVFYSLQ